MGAVSPSVSNLVISGGNLTTSAGYTLTATNCSTSNGKRLTVAGPVTIGTLDLSGPLTVNSSRTLTITDECIANSNVTITLNGTIDLGSSGTLTVSDGGRITAGASGIVTGTDTSSFTLEAGGTFDTKSAGGVTGSTGTIQCPSSSLSSST
ncbi:MAG: hypothetical protein PHO32_00045 [Candidatus Cloacimonetes bacterium]|nr:hypothetical protein [Candidatus Cloacimonadota bacterium]